MEPVILCPKLQLQTDSREYEVLYHAAVQSATVPGASVEIGVREGGGSELIMRASHGYNRSRVHVAIDPWGDLPYILSGQDSGYHYTDEMRHRCMVGLSTIQYKTGVDVLVMPMCDTDFFERYADGVPFYRAGQDESITRYSLVHFDGPHNLDDIRKEVDFFTDRMSCGSWWVFDDVYLYDHAALETDILAAGFVRQDAPYSPQRPNPIKASYRKVG